MWTLLTWKGKWQKTINFTSGWQTVQKYNWSTVLKCPLLDLSGSNSTFIHPSIKCCVVWPVEEKTELLKWSFDFFTGQWNREATAAFSAEQNSISHNGSEMRIISKHLDDGTILFFWFSVIAATRNMITSCSQHKMKQWPWPVPHPVIPPHKSCTPQLCCYDLIRI